MTRRRTRRAPEAGATDTAEVTEYETTADAGSDTAFSDADAGGDAVPQDDKLGTTDDDTQSDTEVPRTPTRAARQDDNDTGLAALPGYPATTTDDESGQPPSAQHDGRLVAVRRGRSHEFSGPVLSPGADAPMCTLAAADGDMRGALARQQRVPSAGTARARAPFTGTEEPQQLSMHVTCSDDNVAPRFQHVLQSNVPMHDRQARAPRAQPEYNVRMYPQEPNHNVPISDSHIVPVPVASTERDARVTIHDSQTRAPRAQSEYNVRMPLQEPNHDVPVSVSYAAPVPVASTERDGHARSVSVVSNTSVRQAAMSHYPQPVTHQLDCPLYTAGRGGPERHTTSTDRTYRRADRHDLTMRKTVITAPDSDLESIHQRRREHATADTQRVRARRPPQSGGEPLHSDNYQRVTRDLQRQSFSWIPAQAPAPAGLEEPPAHIAAMKILMEELQCARKERDRAQQETKAAQQQASEQRRRTSLQQLDRQPPHPYPTTEEDSDLEVPTPRFRRAMKDAKEEFERYGRVLIKNRRPGDERRYLDEDYMSSDATQAESIYSTSQEPTPRVEDRFAGHITDSQLDDYTCWPIRKLRRADKHVRQRLRATGAAPKQRGTLPHARRTPFQPVKARDAHAYQREGRYVTDIDDAMTNPNPNRELRNYRRRLKRDLGLTEADNDRDVGQHQQAAARQQPSAHGSAGSAPQMSRSTSHDGAANNKASRPRRVTLKENDRMSATEQGYSSTPSDVARSRARHRQPLTSGSETETEARSRRREARRNGRRDSQGEQRSPKRPARTKNSSDTEYSGIVIDRSSPGSRWRPRMPYESSSDTDHDGAIEVEPKKRSNMKLKVPPFLGHNWASFRNGFEKAAKQNGWSEDDKASALYVAVNHDKTAAKALQGLHTLKWGYDKLVQTMEARFGRNKTWADILPETRRVVRALLQPLPQYYDRIMYLLGTAKITEEQAQSYGFNIYLNGLHCSRTMLNEVMSKVKHSTIDELHDLCMEYESLHGLSEYDPDAPHSDYMTSNVFMVRPAEDNATQTYPPTPVANPMTQYSTQPAPALPGAYQPQPAPALPGAYQPQVHLPPQPAPQQEQPLPSFVNAFRPATPTLPQPNYQSNSYPTAQPPTYENYTAHSQQPPQAFTAPGNAAPGVGPEVDLAAENERLRREVQDTKQHYNKRLDFFDRRIRKMEGRPPPEEQPNRFQAERTTGQGGRGPYRDNYNQRGGYRDNYNNQGGYRDNYNAQGGRRNQWNQPPTRQPPPQQNTAPTQDSQPSRAPQGPPPPATQYQNAQNEFAQAMPIPTDGVYRRAPASNQASTAPPAAPPPPPATTAAQVAPQQA